jgi:eukaryotic-like serine/threonine-protein kinase
MARFRREAQVLASLNHPNIAAIFGVEEQALVMELVEGPTLAQRIQRAAIPVEETLAIAKQIAEGLEFAHEAGVVHRDLKPANIKVTRQGRVKVLDFGLATVTRAAWEQRADLTQTLTVTAVGTVMGTPAYMAPEQAQGKPVDKRADIWAFGVILYEMFAGRRLFQGESTPDIFASVLTSQPDWNAIPLHIRPLLRRCLERDPRRRLRDIGEARVTIEDCMKLPPHVNDEDADNSHRRGHAWWAGWLAALALAGLAAVSLVVPRTAPQPVMTGVLLGGPGEPQCPRPSPDGHMVAFLSIVGGADQLPAREEQMQIGVMKPETGDSLILTHNPEFGWNTGLSWSPDGSRIYYDRNLDVPVGVYSVPVLGGKEQLLLEDAGAPEALPDGSLLVAKLNAERRLQLFRFWPESGRLQGFAVEVETFFDIRSSPDGGGALVIGKRIGSTDETGDHVYTVDLTSGAVRRVPSGFADDSSLSAVAMTRDGKSILVAGLAGSGSQIMAVPRDGRGHPRLVLSLTAVIDAMDTGPDGAIYLDQLDRPADLVQFRASGGRAEKIGTVPYYEGGPFAVLPDGRAAVQMTAAGHTRIVAFEQGKTPAPLINTLENTRTPATALGPDQIAFLIGPEEHPTIGVATTANGRLTHRIPFEHGSPSSLSGAPNGQTLYCAADGFVWSIPVAGGKPSRMHAGDYVAADPRGHYLVIEMKEGAGNRFVRVPLDGGADQEVPRSAGLRPAWNITANAVGPDGRVLSPLAVQSYYWPPGVIDPVTGIATRIPVDYFGDYHGLGWTKEGHIIGMALAERSKIWKYVPEVGASAH